jgi:ABC-type nitrate/sulfonate/bicarbonate transport system permease component
MSQQSVTNRDIIRRDFLSHRRVQQLIVWGSLLLLWEIAGRSVGDFFLAPFSATVVAFIDLYTSGVILEPLFSSLQQLVVGFLLALGVSLPLGMAIGRSEIIKKSFEPYISFMFVTSVSSMLPLLIIIFGTRLQFRTAVVFLFCVFHMLLTFQAGVEDIDRELIQTGHAYEAGGTAMFRHVIFPASLPMIITGVRLGIGRAFKGMVLAELWILAGVGELLNAYQLYQQIDYLLAVILTLMILAIFSVKSLYWLEETVAPWRGAIEE